ncbi:serine acetyltransferase [Apibacter muscae]|uniref:Serine acetyltransferase n=1 Tax=Apibacter muscae TaxID=2509004 RepID=A0A563DHJ5_9FLAO|nr:serine acetyltransferase [Apibacter muscae]TWP29284.1 serine acetyltransferase [Apibacter muscae]TWP31098.1 serine acetyltransferase [Apibacter muscae]
MKTSIQKDYYRHTSKWINHPWIKTIFNIDFRYTYLFRKISEKKTPIIFNFFLKSYYKFLSKQINYHIDLKATIGDGFYIIHAHRLYVGPRVIIGKNCNFSHCTTIGQTKGRDNIIIGNKVWIGTYCVLDGNITIGNNVLIAPLTYVNFNVPDNSIVIGNPAKIIKRENATEDYINNTI